MRFNGQEYARFRHQEQCFLYNSARFWRRLCLQVYVASGQSKLLNICIVFDLLLTRLLLDGLVFHYESWIFVRDW